MSYNLIPVVTFNMSCMSNMIRYVYPRSLAVLSTLLIGVMSGGCNESSPAVHTAARQATPEDGFEAIVALVRDGIELPASDVGSLIAQRSGSSSRFQVHNAVASKLIPPAAAGDPYRGKITISSQSVYSLRRTADDDEDTKDRDKSESSNSGWSQLDGDDSDSGFQSFDRNLVSDDDAQEEGTKGSDIQSVQRRADKVDRVYDLEYRNGRWELITQLDPKTEASVKNAFDRALRLQP